MTKKEFERMFRMLAGYVVDAVVFGCLFVLMRIDNGSSMFDVVLYFLFLLLFGFLLFWGTTLYARLSVKAEDYTIRPRDVILSALVSVIPYGIVLVYCFKCF